jgi:exopolysaccharide production protein ExoQ
MVPDTKLRGKQKQSAGSSFDERPNDGADPTLDWDGAYAFILFIAMLFIVQLGTYGAVIFSLLTIAYAIARRRMLRDILRGRWFLLVFPAFAVLSTIWSDVPLETFKHSMEFALTIFAALALGASRNRRSVLLGMFAAFAIYVVVSLVVGNVVDVGTNGVRAVAGLNDSKNEQADTAATGLVISVSLFVMGLRRRSLLQCAIAAAAAAAEIYAVVAALSAGALAGSAIAIATLGLLLLLSVAGRSMRATVVGVIGVGATAAALIFVAFTSDVLEWLATAFGKDATLTGRTYLWGRARDLLVENRLFGKGFGAFWQQGNLDAEGLWQFAGITNREGFNFHSTIYDILVSLGWIGMIIFGLTLIVGLASVAADYVRRPTLAACFWLSMAVYLLIRMPVESIGFNEFYFSTVLLFALLASAAGPVRVIAGARKFHAQPAWRNGPVRAGGSSVP